MEDVRDTENVSNPTYMYIGKLEALQLLISIQVLVTETLALTITKPQQTTQRTVTWHSDARCSRNLLQGYRIRFF